MKRSLILSLAFLFVTCGLSAAETIEGGYEPAGGDTIRQLNDLIEVTESSLVKLRELRQQFLDYATIKASYLQQQQNKEQILRMVKAAGRLQKTIQAQNLTHTFDPEIIKELAFFSQVASKKGLARP